MITTYELRWIQRILRKLNEKQTQNVKCSCQIEWKDSLTDELRCIQRIFSKLIEKLIQNVKCSCQTEWKDSSTDVGQSSVPHPTYILRRRIYGLSKQLFSGKVFFATEFSPIFRYIGEFSEEICDTVKSMLSLVVDQWAPDGTCSQVLRMTSVDS